MRIIDKITDFYDYLQNIYRDDRIVFDRTDSFLLTKRILCEYLRLERKFTGFGNDSSEQRNFLLMQICNTFWLFLVRLTKISGAGLVEDYELELISTWRNYNKMRVLISLNVIEFRWSAERMFDKLYHSNDTSKVIPTLTQAIANNDFRIWKSIDRHTVWYGVSEKAEKHIPVLKACGIAGLVDPSDVYFAFEEYFSLEKTASERTESVGLTDREKVENHGFDLKTSFRGKNT